MLISLKWIQRTVAVSLFPAVALLNGCAKEDDASSSEDSTFEVIQQQILTPNCATSGCHGSTADRFYAQHELVLEKSVAYKNLVNAASKNDNARKDGLLRVKPHKSSESLLFHKLHQNAAHHSGSYGSPMPLGMQSLTNGEIEFIRRWIEAGAPEKGKVADVKLLDDTSRPAAEAYTPLAAPAAGTGFQLRIAPFEITPNFEREIFVHRKIGNTEPVYISRIESKMRTNSHHLVLYSFSASMPAAIKPPFDVIRDLRNPSGTINLSTAQVMGYHEFLAAGLTGYMDYKFPEGTALLLPANMSADFNLHYVNKTSASIAGEAQVNLYTIPAGQVKNAVKTINFNNTDISLPPGQRKVVSKTFKFSRPAKVITLTSHTHALGEKFVIRISGGVRNGEIVYTSTDWEHPALVNFDTPIVLKAGEGLTSEVTYNNTTTRTVNFGLTSTDEMSIIFGYYYEE